MYHRGGGTVLYKKILNSLYILLQTNALIDIKISIIDFFFTNMARYTKLYCFIYFMNEKFNKNAKVDKFTTMLGIAVRLIVIDPLTKLDRKQDLNVLYF